MAHLPSEMNVARGGGGVIITGGLCTSVCLVVGAGKGQHTVTDRIDLLTDLLNNVNSNECSYLLSPTSVNVLGAQFLRQSDF